MANILDILPIQEWKSLCFKRLYRKLRLKNQTVQFDKASSKNIYSEIRSRYETNPKFEEKYSGACLDWHDIYKLPFSVLIDTKSREFQYKI